MLCKNCGKLLDENATICVYCGEQALANSGSGLGSGSDSDSGSGSSPDAAGSSADASADAAQEPIVGQYNAGQAGYAQAEETIQPQGAQAAEQMDQAQQGEPLQNESAAGFDTSFGSAPSKKRRASGAIAAIVGVVILAAAVGGAFYFLRPKTNPKDLFFNAIALEAPYKSGGGASDIAQFYSGLEYAKYASLAQSTPSTTSADISFEIGSSLMEQIEDAAYGSGFDIAKLIEDLSIKFEVKADPIKTAARADGGASTPLSSGEFETMMALRLAGQDFVSAECVMNADGMLALRSNELHPQYIGVDLASLSSEAANGYNASDDYFSAFMTGFASSFKPDANQKLVEFAEALEIPPDVSASLLKRYLDTASSAVEGDRFTQEEGAAMEGVSGKTYTKVTASLTGADLKDAILACLAAARDDSELRALAKEKYTAIYDFVDYLIPSASSLTGVMNPANAMPVPEAIDGLLTAGLASLEAIITSQEIDGDYLFELFIDGNALCGFHLFAQAYETTSSVWAKSYDSDGAQRMDLALDVESQEYEADSLSLTISSALRAQGGGGSHNLSIAFSNPQSGSVDLSFEATRQGPEETFRLTAGYAEDYGAAPVQVAELVFSFKGEGGDKYSNVFEINVNGPTDLFAGFTSGVSPLFKMRMDSTAQLGAVQIPQIASEDVIIINENAMDDGTFDGIIYELSNNAQSFIISNMEELNKYLDFDLSGVMDSGY